MSQQTRWLHWDGLFTLFGVCNQMMDSTETTRGLQARLKWLGFYDGDVDGALNDATKTAIKNFKAFPDEVRTQGEGQTTDTVDAALRQRLDALYEYGTGKRAIGTAAPAEPSARLVSRTEHGEDDDIGATLTAPEPLAVRIEVVPKEFKPFEEFAGIKVKFTGYERVQSLLFRVYHSYAETTDATTVDHHRLVYQEVLSRAEIEQLWDDKPGGKFFSQNIGKYSAETARVLRAKRYYGHDYVTAAKGPYKFKAWIATGPGAFDAYADPEKLSWELDVLDDEWLRAHLIEFARDAESVRELRDMVRQRRANQDNPAAPDPVIAANQLVHDQTHHNPTGRAAWKHVWTSKTNKLEQNLTQPKCATHTDQFHRDNEQIVEAFAADTFLNDPVGTYLTMWRRAKAAADGNFNFPELADAFTNMKRHLNRMRARLCCGRDSRAPAALKQQITGCLDKLERQVGAVVSAGYKYHDSLRMTAAFVEVWDWIVAHTRTLPEIEHYQLTGLDFKGTRNESVFQMQRLGACRTAFLTTRHDPSANYTTQYMANALGVPNIENILDGSSGVRRRSGHVERMIPIREIIAFPSYNALDEVYFTRIRQSPMFILGVIDLDYLDADAHKYSPWEFFQHDGFHTVANEGSEIKAPQLWHTLAARMKALNGGATGFENEAQAERVMRVWHGNTGLLRELVHDLGTEDAPLEEALDIVLFCILHEPIVTQRTNPLPASFPPALVEPDSLRARLDDAGLITEILGRVNTNWFGALDPAVIHSLQPALDLIKVKCRDLTRP